MSDSSNQELPQAIQTTGNALDTSGQVYDVSALDTPVVAKKDEDLSFVRSLQKRQQGRRRLVASLPVAAVVIVGIVGVGILTYHNKPTVEYVGPAVKSQDISLTSLGGRLDKEAANPANTLTINGQVVVGDSLVLESAGRPSKPVAGQIFYDNGSNSLTFFNGTDYISLIGGDVVNTQVTNSPVTNNYITAPVNNVSNVSNVTNVANVTNVTNVNNVGSGIAGTGTVGAIAVFTSANQLGDSLINQNGGNLNLATAAAAGATGSVNITTGDSSTTASGNISIDSGSNIISGTVVGTKTFEAGLDSMVDWFNTGLSQSNAQAHQGSNSLAVSTSSNFWGIIEDQNNPGTPVVAGHQYNFSLWVRANTVGRNISGAVVWSGAATTTNFSVVTDNNSGWTQMSLTAPAPAGATKAYFEFSTSSGGAGEVHYFDDFVVTDLSSATAFSAIEIGKTNAKVITIGNMNTIGATSIFGGSGINLAAGAATFTTTSGVIDMTANSASSIKTTAGALTLTSADAATWGVATSATGDGANLTLKAGNGLGVGNTDGGNLILMAGTANGTGVAGGVGIGTASPRGTLDLGIDGATLVIGDIIQGGELQFGSADGTNAIGFNNNGFNFRTSQSNGFMFYTDTDNDMSTPEMVLSDAGDLGIGTDTPGYKLDVAGTLHVQSAADAELTAFLHGRAAQSVPTLRIQQGASQSGRALEVLDSNGNTQFMVNEFGVVATGSDFAVGRSQGINWNAESTYNRLSIGTGADNMVGETIYVGGSQTANAFEIKDNTLTPIAGFAGLGQLFLGKASNIAGSMKLFNAANGNSIIIQSGATSTGYTLTLPTAVSGVANQCLVDTTGAGVLGFSACLTGAPGDYIQNGTAIQTANYSIQSADAADIAARIYGAAGQTADIFQVRADSVTAPLLGINNIGVVTLQPSDDTAPGFVVKSSTGNNMLTVDSANSRVGIGLSSGNLPSLVNKGLEVNGAIRLSSIGGSFTDDFITPLGVTLRTRINIPLYDPGNFNQILALGLPSGASSTSRAVMLVDARGAANNQPALGLLDPTEADIFGLSWDGSSSVAALKTMGSDMALRSGALNLLFAKADGSGIGIGNSNPGYKLDVTGDIRTTANLIVGAAANQLTTITAGAGHHTIELGRTDATASNPHIDFHSSGANIDFDSRIVASGGGTLGSGTLDLQANLLLLSSATRLKPGSGNSATAFEVQNASSQDVLNVDTINQTISLRALDATTSVFNLLHSDGTVAFEMRTGGIGGQNSFLGQSSGDNLTSGIRNTSVGSSALGAVTTGSWNTAVGVDALINTADGWDNTAMGEVALRDNVDGHSNSAYGMGSLLRNVSGSWNTSMGASALDNADSQGNTAVGSGALSGITAGDWNTGLGIDAGRIDNDDFVTPGGLSGITVIGAQAQAQANSSLILGGAGSGAVNVGIGTTIPLNTFSVSPVYYSTGTASQSGTTVTGTGTNFDSSMLYRQIIFANGLDATIIAVNGPTDLTVDVSQTVADMNYRIHHYGLQVTSDGRVGVGTPQPGYGFEVRGESNFQSIVDTTTAFQIQNSALSPLFVADTQNMVLHSTGKFVSWGRLAIGEEANNWINDTITGVTEGVAPSTDGYFFAPVSNGGSSDLRLYIADDADDAFSIWGNMCQGNCGEIDDATQVAYFQADGYISLSNAAGLVEIQGDSNIFGNLYVEGYAGVMLPAADKPMITNGWDAFTSGAYDGIGRWGMIMEPTTLTLAVPDIGGNGNFQIARYNDDSTIASIPFFVKNDGNVGIGTIDPESRLEIRQDVANGTGPILILSNKASDPNTNATAQINFGLDDSETITEPNAQITAFNRNNTGNNDADLIFSTYNGSALTENLRIQGETGNIVQQGSGTFTTGTGNVSLNGDVTIASGKNLTANGTALFKNAANSTTAFQVQDSANTALFLTDTQNKIIRISGTDTSFTTLELADAHFKLTQTTAPAIGTPSNCGATPTAAVTAGSTDNAGSFTITTGTGGTSTTCDTVITFQSPFGAAPKSIMVVGKTDVASVQRQIYVTGENATTFTVAFATSAGGANSTTYSYSYWVVE